MNMTTDAVYAALLRENFYTFLRKVFQTLNRDVAWEDNWHLHVLAYELEGVARGRTKRFIVNMPPRSLKSIAASVALVAWYLGRNPSAEVICASYGQDLSAKFAYDCRTIMQSTWYQAIFPTRIAPGKSGVADFRTTAGGGRLATSVGGPMTGRGADLIVIDDPAKPDEMLSEVQRDAVNRWIHSTVFSRLNNKAKGAIVVAMQRLHMLDLTGFLMATPGWTLLRLAAVAETDERYVIHTVGGEERILGRKEGEALHAARESFEALATIQQALGSYLYAAQYQQTPMAPDGNIVKLSWFRRYETLPERFEQIVQSWDTASKTGELNSYSVCTTWGLVGKNAYLLHVFRQRMEYPELKRAVKEQAALWKPNVILVEEKSSGAALLQELKRENIYVLKEVKPSTSKVMRMSSQTAFIEGGFVHLPKEAPWLQAYENELMLFPIGQYDDQADSTSQALAYLQEQLQEPGLLVYYREQALAMGVVMPDLSRFFPDG